jgi:hypothetical protein
MKDVWVYHDSDAVIEAGALKSRNALLITCQN